MFHPHRAFRKKKKVAGVELFIEELEALRLKDLEGLSQKECAVKMKVSQPTFHRLLAQARGKVADAVINGKSLELNANSH